MERIDEIWIYDASTPLEPDEVEVEGVGIRLDLAHLLDGFDFDRDTLRIALHTGPIADDAE